MPPVPSQHAQRRAVDLEHEAGLGGSSPTSSVACQAVTSSRRSCPAIAAAPIRPVRTDSVPFSGPSLCVPAGSGMRGA